MAKTVIEEFVARIGVDVPASEVNKLAKFEKGLDSIISGFAKVAVAAYGAATAFGVAMSATNRATWQQANLAKAYGASAETLENFGYLLDEVGMEGGELLRSFRALANGIGGGTKAARKALQQLGLSYAELKRMSPEDQFIRIMEAARGAADGQVAAAAAAKLLGRDAIRLVGWARLQSQSIADVLEEQRQMNFMTDEARAGAISYAAELDNINDSLSSMWKALSGLVGKALTPYLKQLKEWIKNNRELIKAKIKEWAEKIAAAVQWLWNKLVWLVKVLRDLLGIAGEVILKLGGLDAVLGRILILFGGVLTAKAVLSIMKLTTALKTFAVAAQLSGKRMVGIGLALLSIYLLAQDVYTFFTGGDSLTEHLLRWLGADDETINAIKKQWGEEGILGTFRRFGKEVKQIFRDIADQIEKTPLIGPTISAISRFRKAGNEFLDPGNLGGLLERTFGGRDVLSKTGPYSGNYKIQGGYGEHVLSRGARETIQQTNHVTMPIQIFADTTVDQVVPIVQDQLRGTFSGLVKGLNKK